MAHYALLDANNVVVQVIVGKDEGEDGVDWEEFYENFHGLTCKRTSYNTNGGVNPVRQPFRKNYAGIGYVYDPVRDAFIAPKPAENFVFDEEKCVWMRSPEIGLLGNPVPIIHADGVSSVVVYLYGAANASVEILMNSESVSISTDDFGYGEFELSSDTPGLLTIEWNGVVLEVAAV